MQAIVGQAFFCSARVGDLCSSEELSSVGRDRGSRNKMCFETTVPLSDQEFSLHSTSITVPSVIDESINNYESNCLILSDDLAYFDAVYQYQAINAGRRGFKLFLHPLYINAIRMITKIGLKHAYHVFYFSNTVFYGILLLFPVFLIPIHGKIFHKRPPSCGDIIITPRTDAWLCLSEGLINLESYD